MNAIPWFWQSLITAFAAGGAVVLAFRYPSAPSTIFAVVTSVGLFILLFCNPAYWLRRAATGLFATAAGIAAVPDLLTYFLDSERVWFAKLESASPWLSGLFLAAGIVVAGLEVIGKTRAANRGGETPGQVNNASMSGGKIKGNVTIKQTNRRGGD